MSDRAEPVIRPLRETDWAPIEVIQAAAFPPEACEDVATFACHHAVSPSTCLVAESRARIVAYILAHPWRRDIAPPMNTLYSELPPDCDTLFVHDLALLPDARGSGLARRMVESLLDSPPARALPLATLVSVQESGPFWQRFGFEPTTNWPDGFHQRMRIFFPAGNFLLMDRPNPKGPSPRA